MIHRHSFVGVLSRAPVLRSAWLRRAIMAVLIAICLFLSFFPEKYRAAVTLTPTDPASLGLSGALTQLGAINSVFGNQAAVEVALKVARSIYVRDTVLEQTELVDRLELPNQVAGHRWLEDEVTVRSLRGGIILFETHNRDPELARAIVSAYSQATQTRLAEINRRQTDYKREVLVKLVSDASDRLARAQTAYDSFRMNARVIDPELALQAESERIPTLEAEIRAKDVELNAARQFYTPDHMVIRQLAAERQELAQQLAQAKATNPMQDDSAGRAVQASTRAQRLLRELNVAKALYDSYMRFLEGTSVEDLTSTASVRVLEPPFIDTERQIDYRYAALALALALLWAAVEFYRLRPPVGDRTVVVDESYA